MNFDPKDLRLFTFQATCQLCGNNQVSAAICTPLDPAQQVHPLCKLDVRIAHGPGRPPTVTETPVLGTGTINIGANEPHVHRVCAGCGFHWIETLTPSKQKIVNEACGSNVDKTPQGSLPSTTGGEDAPARAQ